jgi:putative DeoR family transcriptional regulator (stage III sporulation protein D)
MMSAYEVETRAIQYGSYIVDTKSTIRQCAEYFGVSKSTVHRYISLYLFEADTDIWTQVVSIMHDNLAERHYRGGRARALQIKKHKEELKC